MWSADWSWGRSQCPERAAWKIHCHLRCRVSGLSAIVAAELQRAGIIIVVDVNPQRLELAKALGATHAIIGSEGDVVRRIREICQPLEGVDSALDCSGMTTVIENVIDLLAIRGRAINVGAPAPGKRESVGRIRSLDPRT